MGYRIEAVLIMSESCGTFDIQCHMRNAMAEMLDNWSKSLGQFGKEMLAAAFSGDGGGISTKEWSVATTMTSKWALVLLIVVIGMAAVQVIISLIQGNPRVAVSAALWGILAWPTTLISIFLAIRVTAASDALSVGILDVSGGDAGADAASKVFSLTQAGRMADGGQGLLEQILRGPGSDPVTGSVSGLLQVAIVSFDMVLITLIAAFFLSMMLAFRNFALLVLVGFAPLAFMALPVGALRAWAIRWAQAVLALIIAKPVAAGMLVMSGELLGAADQLFSWLVGLAAMAMAGFAPMITMRMFSFIGGETAAAYGSHGSAVVNNAASGVTRVGSTAVQAAV